MEFVYCIGEVGHALVCLVRLLAFVGFCQAGYWGPFNWQWLWLWLGAVRGLSECQLRGCHGWVGWLDWLWFEGNGCVSIVNFVEGDVCGEQVLKWVG